MESGLTVNFWEGAIEATHSVRKVFIGKRGQVYDLMDMVVAGAIYLFSDLYSGRGLPLLLRIEMHIYPYRQGI